MTDLFFLPDSNFTREELLPDESTTARLRGTHINANVVTSFSLSLRCRFIIVVIIMIVIIWVDKLTCGTRGDRCSHFNRSKRRRRHLILVFYESEESSPFMTSTT